jgi:hypothetical protein
MDHISANKAIGKGHFKGSGGMPATIKLGPKQLTHAPFFSQRQLRSFSEGQSKKGIVSHLEEMPPEQKALLIHHFQKAKRNCLVPNMVQPESVSNGLSPSRQDIFALEFSNIPNAFNIIQRKTRNLSLPSEDDSKIELYKSFGEIVAKARAYNDLKNEGKPREYLSDQIDRLVEIDNSIDNWFKKHWCCCFIKCFSCFLLIRKGLYLKKLSIEVNDELSVLKNQFKIVMEIEEKYSICLDNDVAREALVTELKRKLPAIRAIFLRNTALQMYGDPRNDELKYRDIPSMPEYKLESDRITDRMHKLNADRELGNPIISRPWTLEELQDLEAALGYFDKLLGPHRINASVFREQPITCIGRFAKNFCSANGDIEPKMQINDYGETLESTKVINIFDASYKSLDENYDLSKFQLTDKIKSDPKGRMGFRGTIIHELAHGLLEKSRLNGDDSSPFVLYLFARETRFWLTQTKTAIYSDLFFDVTENKFEAIKQFCSRKIPAIEPPISYYGTKSVGEDFAESIRYFLQGDETRSLLQEKCPIRFRFIMEHISKLLNLDKMKPSVISIPTERSLATEIPMNASPGRLPLNPQIEEQKAKPLGRESSSILDHIVNEAEFMASSLSIESPSEELGHSDTDEPKINALPGTQA